MSFRFKTTQSYFRCTSTNSESGRKQLKSNIRFKTTHFDLKYTITKFCIYVYLRNVYYN